MYILGVDIGTYESKAVLIDASGQVVAQASLGHELSVPRPGWAEHDADGVWWHDFVQLVRAVMSRAAVRGEEIAAVGCSAIGPCVLPVDRSGRPLRPAILYGIDTRATAEVAELTALLGEEWLVQTTGSPLSAQSAGPKILWLQRHEPATWQKTWRVMTATSYLVYRLTGRVVMDHYTACAYAPLYNPHTLTWEPKALAHVCSAWQLPELGWATDVAGTVTREAAEETGLQEGTPVAVGTCDAAAEAVSAGVVEPGSTMLMYGTTLFFIQVCPAFLPNRFLWPAVFLAPGTYALAAGTATAGAVTRWFRDQFGQPEQAVEAAGGAPAYAALAELAARAPAGSRGLLALPYFSGERTPIHDPWARGVLAGLSLAHTRAEVYRALLEGIAYSVRHNLETMQALGAPPRRLVAVGGGTRNRLWLQIVSDVTGLDQSVPPSPGAAYGDALLAGLAAGVLPVKGLKDLPALLPSGAEVRPNPAAARVYEKYYGLYLRLYEQTKEVVHALARLASQDPS